MSFHPDRQWLQQYAKTHPAEAARSGLLSDTRAVTAVRTPLTREEQAEADAEAFRLKLRTAAKRRDWKMHTTWSEHGEEPGLYCWLVKGARLLLVIWQPQGVVMTQQQQAFNEELGSAPGREVYTWPLDDWTMIENALTAPRRCSA